MNLDRYTIAAAKVAARTSMRKLTAIGGDIAARIQVAADARCAIAERFFALAVPADDADPTLWRAALEQVLLDAKNAETEWRAALSVARDYQQAVAASAATLAAMEADDVPSVDPRLN